MPPQDVKSLPAYLSQEFSALARALSLPSEKVSLTPLSTPPAKPRAGDIVHAIAPWNPGAGDGIYWFNGTAWGKL
jgi:hypothetical protein